MPFPGSREETATPANPVSSATINAIQDAIVDIYNIGGIARPSRQRKISAHAGMYLGGTPFLNTGYVYGWRSTAGADAFSLPLVLDSGEKLTKVIIDAEGDAGGGASASVYVVKRSTTAGAFDLTETGTIPAANAIATVVLDNFSGFYGGGALAELVADDTFHYYVVIICSGVAPIGTGVKIYGARYYTEIPAP